MIEAEDSVRVWLLDEPKRGPGGGVYRYCAAVEGTIAYGNTAAEAKRELGKRLNPDITKVVEKDKAQVGWFVWTHFHGQIHRKKYIIEGDKLHPDSKKFYEDQEVMKHPLDAQHWALGLDELALLFPLPDELRERYSAPK